MSGRSSAALLGLLLATLPPVAAVAGGVTWNVDLDGNGDFSSIQAAVDAAEDGDTLIIAAGTYAEAVDLTDKAVTLQGAGIGQTTISGTGDDTTLTVGVDLGGEATLVDLTIAGGDARGTDGYGGCMDVVEASPLVERVEFRDCEADLGGCVSLRGSGATLRNVWIHGCEATVEGGGLYVEGGNPELAWLRVHDCGAVDFGGGVDLYETDATLTDSWLSANHADWGGGLMLHEGHPVVERVSTTDNVACQGGGGHAHWLTDATVTEAALYRNRIGTSADGCDSGYPDGSGGGIWMHTADSTISASILAYNDSDEADGGAIATAYGSTPIIERSVFIWNEGGDGGAIATGIGSQEEEVGAFMTLTASLLSDNTAETNSGAMLLYTGGLFEGLLVADNGGKEWSYDGAVDALPFAGQTVTLRNNVFTSNSGGVGTVGLGNESTVFVNNTVYNEDIVEESNGGVIRIWSDLDVDADLRSNIVAASTAPFDVYAPSPAGSFVTRIDYNWLEGDFGGQVATPDGSNNTTGVTATFVDTDPDEWDTFLRPSGELLGAGDPSLGEPQDPGAFGGQFATVWDEGDQDGDGVTVWESDCNDDDADVHPGAEERCNCRDDDCDTAIDEGCSTTGPCFEDGPVSDDDDATDDDATDDDDDDSGDDDDSAAGQAPAAGCLIRCDAGDAGSSAWWLTLAVVALGRRRYSSPSSRSTASFRA